MTEAIRITEEIELHWSTPLIKKIERNNDFINIPFYVFKISKTCDNKSFVSKEWNKNSIAACMKNGTKNL